MLITYEDGQIIESTDNQQVFNRVVTKLMEQGCKSQDITGTCLYRHRDEVDENLMLKCAAGHLILDKDYHEGFEEQSVFDNETELATTTPGKYFKSMGFDLEFLSALQAVHDHNNFDMLLGGYKRVTEQYHLDGSILDKYSTT